jgi:hypothetical protein
LIFALPESGFALLSKEIRAKVFIRTLISRTILRLRGSGECLSLAGACLKVSESISLSGRISLHKQTLTEQPVSERKVAKLW